MVALMKAPDASSSKDKVHHYKVQCILLHTLPDSSRTLTGKNQVILCSQSKLLTHCTFISKLEQVLHLYKSVYFG
ncbi:hypothetical protein Hamer_G019151 [Homarus americanus]|uniref:Uncharacterized protein n=1 Tax=Homarus americanus TaxID=6706 RepID=A0A8J5MN35_HOMAM|nr:hypothetical protein Hamer_G019151 [Homarus americanus]